MTLTLPATDIVSQAIELARRAPSLHNSQPWRWRYENSRLNLYADTSRIIPSTDSAGRELVLSCGVMLHHVRAVMASLGWKSFIERFPNPNDALHLAQLGFYQSEFVTPAEQERVTAMQERRTDRLPYSPPAGWETFELVLRHNLQYEVGDAVTLTVVPDDQLPELARASDLADTMRRYDSRYHAELNWWAGHSSPSAGMPSESLPSPAERERVGLGRAFPIRENADRRPDVDRDGAKVVVLATDSDQLRDILQCGEALSTVLLEATIAGYATCPLTHMIEVHSSRLAVQKMAGGRRMPQVLIRIGTSPDHSASLPRTPRRAVTEVLEIRR